MATPNYDVNYEDERFKQVESEKDAALNDLNNTYNNMINSSDQYYQQQIDAAKDYATTQQQLQQQQTDFIVEQQNQQKDKAHKDYLKEQSGAYVDWQKQSNKYGANAEQMAAQGLQGTGFSESSQVSMFNAYQNRVATARETYNTAILNYDNAIKDAQLQNNSKLAEIAYQALQAELEIGLQGFQYKNQLLTEQMNKQKEYDEMYYNRYQDVLAQINQENAMAEEVRQYNESMAMQKQQLEEEIRQYNQSYQLQVKQFNEEIRQFNEEIARLKAKDKQEYELEIKQLELQKKQLEEEKRQADLDYKVKQAQLELEKKNLSSSSGSSGGSSSKKSSSSSSSKKSSSSSSSSKKITKTKSSSSTKKSSSSSSSKSKLLSGSWLLQQALKVAKKQANKKK